MKTENLKSKITESILSLLSVGDEILCRNVDYDGLIIIEIIGRITDDYIYTIPSSGFFGSKVAKNLIKVDLQSLKPYYVYNNKEMSIISDNFTVID